MDKQNTKLSQCISKYCSNIYIADSRGVSLFLLSTCLQGVEYYNISAIKTGTKSSAGLMEDHKEKKCRLPWILPHVFHRRNGVQHLKQQNKFMLITAFLSDI